MSLSCFGSMMYHGEPLDDFLSFSFCDKLRCVNGELQVDVETSYAHIYERST